MLKPRSLFEKIWDAHLIADLGRGGEAGGYGLLLIDRVLLHERTGGIALRSLAESGRAVAYPQQVFATMDHIVDTFPGRGDATLMPTGTEFITTTRAAAHDAGITLFDLGDPRQGIVHVISPELGIVLPGTTLVCADSHTGTQGAMGAMAWGIGSSEAEHALATGTLRVRRPSSMRIRLTGAPDPSVTAKDMALALLHQLGANGARGHIVEFAGPVVAAMPMEARLTLCNMATELGAFGAIIAPDATSFAYLKGRVYAPTGATWDAALANWQTLFSEDDAIFNSDLVITADDMVPMVSWGTSPHQAMPVDGSVPAFAQQDLFEARDAHKRALAYMGLVEGQAAQDLRIDAAFIGSCTNARLSDLRAAAAILNGRQVAASVKAICVPGSTAVKAQAEAEGLDVIFLKAGFEWREAGCSMCFFAGGESFGAQQRVISSTNRNFESRQGRLTRTHIASPATVAASAIAGKISDPRKVSPR
jgi:3-isopropylmalate/(R)-2-methylmalate dehydratase large subunit